jgi:SAM-dependent methyltransferase
MAGAKINFGCGDNRLAGWTNLDAEVDISEPLPFPDDHAEFIFSEHCVEHINYYLALQFFWECRRVLMPGGIIRICVPSIENIMKRSDASYLHFARRWSTGGGVRGAMGAILFKHGHAAAWTASLLEASLFYSGFKNLVPCEPGLSMHPALEAVEGHGKVIGEHMNWIESCIFEGEVDK